MIRRRLLYGLLLGLVASVLASGLWLTGVVDRWENTTWDWRVRQLTGSEDSYAGTAAADSICLILLDQYSLDWGSKEQGLPWPWPREVYSPIIEFCVLGGARTISFDVLYTEPSIHGVYDDQTFGEAILDSKRFIGAIFVHEKADTLAAVEVTWPIDEVVKNSSVLANVSGVPDADGIFRRASLWRKTDDPKCNGLPVPSLGFAAYLQGSAGDEAPAEVVPLNRQQILRYYNPQHSWPVYNAAEVVQSYLQLMEETTPALDPQVVAGRHVFFAFSAPGLMDLRPTPISRVSPGVTVHATMLANLLGDGFVTEPPRWLTLLVVALAAILAAAGLLLVNRAWQTTLVLIVGLVVPTVIGLAAVYQNVWWPVIPGTIAQGISLAGAMIVAYATEGRQKRFIKQAFRYYLSPHVIDRLMADPNQLRLGGQRRELSILFSDLEGFTTISEGLEPQELTTLLNEYLSDMTDIILAEGGTLDKYEGDAIIAFWNAPIDLPDHAERACRAAVTCQRKLTSRRAEFRERFGVEMKMRIGLNSGPVIVGNMGSKQRFDYTVLGDAANLAARLEGANKVFGTYLMISGDTKKMAGDTITARELGELRVVGRSQPVAVYELDGLGGDQEPEHWQNYSWALGLAKEGRAAESAKVFKELATGDNADPAAESWAHRLHDEDEGFDSVWNLTKK